MTGHRIDPELLDNHEFSDHMKMRFEVVDERGKVIKSGRDLDKLKKTVSYKASTNFKQLKAQTSKSIERSDIQEWDFEPLPETVIVETSGMKIKAWPALVDKGNSVAIKLFDSPKKAQQQNGLLRLVLLQFQLEQKAMLKQIPETHKLCLSYNSTGKCDELKASIVKNVFRLTFIDGELQENKHGGQLDKAQFLAQIENKKAEIPTTLKELSSQLLTILSLTHDINKQLKGSIDFSLLETLNDVKDQMASLVYPGFIDDLSMGELRQYPRYLKAVLKRLDRLAGDANKDRMLRLQIQSLWDDYKKLLKKSGESTELREFRWMLEEFRVSLFAQDLGTAYPVSQKRLEKQFAEIKRTI